jgi:Domain of unknown function (DUF4180)
VADLMASGDEQILVYDAESPVIENARQATDLIGEALWRGATVLAIPAEKLSTDFFQLRSGLAGEIAQKAVNYRLKLAVIGDISTHVAASNALRDWVREADRRGDLWFRPSLDDLVDQLAKPAKG